MSFAKGFLISFVLCFLAFAVIILYGGSFALTLIKEKAEAQLEEEQENVENGPSGSSPVNTTHETFSFALVITDTDTPAEEIPEETPESGDENDLPEVGPVARVTTTEENEGGENTETPTDPSTGETPPEGGGDDLENGGDSTEGDTENDGEEEETPSEPIIPEYVIEWDGLLSEYLDRVPEYEIKFICVVSINQTVSKSLITVIPGDTVIKLGGVSLSLSYVNYLSEQPEMKLDNFIPSTVTGMTGIVPDYYGYVDIDDFVTLADTLGGVPYSNGTTVFTEKKSDGSEIIIPEGDIVLDSEMLGGLLEYKAYGSRYGASQVLIDVSREMLSSICTKFRPNIIAKVRNMLEFVKTDFTPDDMSEISDIFFSYESSQKNCIALLGAYERFGDEMLFNPNYLGSVNKFKEFLN